MTPDTPSHYGTISRALHWGMAVAIALMYLLAVAWHLTGQAQALIPVHKALGTLLFMLVFARILWAIAAEQRPRATSLAARLGHLALYLLMLTCNAWQAAAPTPKTSHDREQTAAPPVAHPAQHHAEPAHHPRCHPGA